MSVVLGPRLLKVLWLTGGLALLWVLNVGRILLIFAVGAQWGEHVTIKGLHPYIGLVVFNLGVGVMLLAMRPFGLHLVTAPPQATHARAAVRSDQADPARDHAASRPAVPKARTALIVVGVIGLLVGLTNEGLKSYDLVSTDLGTPRLASFTATALAPAGWAAHKTDTFDWAKQFFGESSTWIRYSYNWDGKPADALRANVPITTDVIQTSDLSTFSTYGIEACYRFHGYKLKDVRSVDLGGGVTGNVVAYYNSAVKTDWTSVYWYWPVKTSSGTRYERIVVMMTDSAKADVASPAPSPSVARSIGLKLQNALSGFHAGTLDAKLLQTRAFLVAFAQSLVSAEKSTPAATAR
jgi:exosortase/archaeosortase family protein